MVSALSLEIREADRIRFYFNKPREQIMPAALNSDIDILLNKNSKAKVEFIKKIIPDFKHLRDN